MMQFRRFICLLTFAIWFGGFTFYISVVVPTGTSVLGSARAQGFVTQQVTHHLNWITAVACCVVMWEVLAGFSRQLKRRRTIAMGIVAAIFLIMLLLVFVHLKLDGFLDFEHRTVRQKSDFYQWHRLYLWASTIQWALGIALAWLLVSSWSHGRLPQIEDQTSTE